MREEDKSGAQEEQHHISRNKNGQVKEGAAINSPRAQLPTPPATGIKDGTSATVNFDDRLKAKLERVQDEGATKINNKNGARDRFHDRVVAKIQEDLVQESNDESQTSKNSESTSPPPNNEGEGSLGEHEINNPPETKLSEKINHNQDSTAVDHFEERVKRKLAHSKPSEDAQSKENRNTAASSRVDYKCEESSGDMKSQEECIALGRYEDRLRSKLENDATSRVPSESNDNSGSTKSENMQNIKQAPAPVPSVEISENENGVSVQQTEGKSTNSEMVASYSLANEQSILNSDEKQTNDEGDLVQVSNTKSNQRSTVVIPEAFLVESQYRIQPIQNDEIVSVRAELVVPWWKQRRYQVIAVIAIIILVVLIVVPAVRLREKEAEPNIHEDGILSEENVIVTYATGNFCNKAIPGVMTYQPSLCNDTELSLGGSLQQGMADATHRRIHNVDPGYIEVSLMHAGMVHDDIAEGEVTEEEFLHATSPSVNYAVAYISVTSDDLVRIINNAVDYSLKGLPFDLSYGVAYPYTSGLRFMVDVATDPKAFGFEIIDLGTGEWIPLDSNSSRAGNNNYWVITNSHIAEGGYDYLNGVSPLKVEITSKNYMHSLMDYLKTQTQWVPPVLDEMSTTSFEGLEIFSSP